MNCNFRGQDFFTVLMQLIPHFFGTLATMNLEKAVFTAQGVEVWPIFGTEQAHKSRFLNDAGVEYRYCVKKCQSALTPGRDWPRFAFLAFLIFHSHRHREWKTAGSRHARLFLCLVCAACFLPLFVFLLCVAVAAITVLFHTSPNRHVNLGNGCYSKCDHLLFQKIITILRVAVVYLQLR